VTPTGVPAAFEPLVISSITWARLLSAARTCAAVWPRYSTEIESATSKTSFMLWLTSTTASPASARRRTSCSTCSVCATPSAAVGSSRITSLEFHSTARAIATVWR
jgi:hypothetical protein